MLDHVCISHQSTSALTFGSSLTTHPGGLILWSRSFTPTFSALAATPASPVNALIREAIIEGKARSEDEGFEKEGYSVRWTMENGLGLVFVVSRATRRRHVLPAHSLTPLLLRSSSLPCFP